MDKSLLNKLKKCDPKELLYWVSSCQAPAPNSERVAIIEYVLAVLLSLDYRKSEKKRKTSRELIKRVIANGIKDVENARLPKQTESNSPLQTFFRLSFLTIRGEAFPWQFAESSMERYGKHEEWMLTNLGFTISDAVRFTKEIMKILTKRTIKWGAPPLPSFTKKEYYDPRFIFVTYQEFKNFWGANITFSENDMMSLVTEDEHQKLKAYLQKLSIDIHEPHYKIESPTDYNILYGKPFVKIGADYLLPLPKILWRVLSTTFHYDFLRDKTYVEKYIDEKGKAAERRMLACFKRFFLDEKLLCRLRYSKRTGWPDIDLVADADHIAFLIECTAKWVTLRAKSGDLNSIIEDLESSIVKCHNQLNRALEACQRGEIALLKNKKLLPIIVVDDYVPHLDFILQFFGSLGKIGPTS